MWKGGKNSKDDDSSGNSDDSKTKTYLIPNR